MKFLGWMQNKFGGKQDIHRNPTNSSTTYHHAKQEAREEFSDWPHGLLAIGTFGNKNEIKHQNPPLDIIKTSTTTTVDQGDDGGDDDDPPSSSSSQENIADFTPEEIGKLQKELTKLLRRKPDVEKEIAELPLDRFLNCPSSLEVDRRISSAVLCSSTTDHSDDRDDDREEDIEKTLSVILGKCKDICADKTKKKKAIGKKSISFLLKKMFVCGSGFAIPPNPRDTLQESRMEKLLRVMLHKKIYSQSTSRVSSMKRCLEDKKMLKKKNEEEEEDDEERTDDGCRWVKTDSEYIVLEI